MAKNETKATRAKKALAKEEAAIRLHTLKKIAFPRKSLGDRIIERANDGYHTRLTMGKMDYPPFAPTLLDDRVRWSKYIKTIADEIEAEDARMARPMVHQSALVIRGADGAELPKKRRPKADSRFSAR